MTHISPSSVYRLSMALVIFLMLISPVLGLQCFHGGCFSNTEALCFPPHVDLTVVNCSHATRCKLTRRTVVSLGDIDTEIGSGLEDSGDTDWNTSVVLTAYHRGCAEDETNRDCEDQTCRTVNDTTTCDETICCNTPLCNLDARFPTSPDSSDSPHTPLVEVPSTTNTPSGAAVGSGSGVSSDAISNGVTLMCVFLSNSVAMLSVAIWH